MAGAVCIDGFEKVAQAADEAGFEVELVDAQKRSLRILEDEYVPTEQDTVMAQWAARESETTDEDVLIAELLGMEV